MKKCIIYMLLISVLFVLCSCDLNGEAKKVEYEIIKTEINDNVWEIYNYDNKLFFGAGDGDENTGPTKIWAYDLDTGELFLSGIVNEEVVNRFRLIDGKLIVPGVDPTEKGGVANYNYYENGKWERYRNITPTQHCFDIIKYKDILVYSVDATDGIYPAFISKNDGKDVEPIRFWKNGERVSWVKYPFVRAFDLYELGGELYTILYVQDYTETISTDVYKLDYEGLKFEYYSSVMGQIDYRSYKNFRMVGSSVTSDDTLYIATPFGYYTNDMKTFHKLELDGASVFDYYYDEGSERLFALCSKKLYTGEIETSIWEKDKNSRNTFIKKLYFKSDYTCVSFEYVQGSFYLGTVDYENGGNGDIIKIED